MKRRTTARDAAIALMTSSCGEFIGCISHIEKMLRERGLHDVAAEIHKCSAPAKAARKRWHEVLVQEIQGVGIKQ
jgi:hypothetical protein